MCISVCIAAFSGCGRQAAVAENTDAGTADTIVAGAETPAAAPADDFVPSEQADDAVAEKAATVAETFAKLLKDNVWLKTNYGFSYPAFMQKKTTFVDDVPAEVTEYSFGPVSICLWPGLGTWATLDEDFPVAGSMLSPTTQIASITYRAERKDIHSGYTTDGRIFYLKRKILVGEGVNHASILVAIYPENYKDHVAPLVRTVQNW